jgi:hypothetical protein
LLLDQVARIWVFYFTEPVGCTQNAEPSYPASGTTEPEINRADRFAVCDLPVASAIAS